jgi:hypothetical protein
VENFDIINKVNAYRKNLLTLDSLLKEYSKIEVIMTLQFFLNHISENSRQRKEIQVLLDAIENEAPQNKVVEMTSK